MGQIVGLNAKCKRANLNALGSVPTPAAGEHILVSSDNSMNAAGQGNFDCYIVGNGQTAATALPLQRIDENIESKIAEIAEKLKAIITTDSEDTFYIVDASGNVIGKFDSTGLSTTDVHFLKDGNLTSLLAALSAKVDKVEGKELSDNNFTDELKALVEQGGGNANIIDQRVELYVTDSNGYVIMKVDNDGVHSVDFISGEKNVGKPLSQFTLYTIGDSLSTGGYWQAKVNAKTGIQFDNTKNVSNTPTSAGGTITGGGGSLNALWRTKNLIDGGYITDGGENEIVIIECVNDLSADVQFDNTAHAVIPTEPVGQYNWSDWGSTLLASIPSEKRAINACLKLLSTGMSGKNLAITTLPTNEGDVTLSITTSSLGVNSYSIHVTPSDTLSTILEKILEYDYAGVTDALADDGQSVDFASPTNVTFADTGNTGMRVTITDTTSAKSSTMFYFIGTSVSQWTDTSAWLDGNNFTFSAGYKSVIELLLNTYPKLKIVLAAFPALATTPSEYLLPNGNYDTAAFYNSTRMVNNRKLRDALIDVGKYYNIPVIDVFGNIGITINNYSAYYHNMNVHPKQDGYARIGDIVAARLIGLFN